MKLSVVAPTYNERENLETLIKQVGDALLDIQYEIIIADDDSPDMTWQLAGELSARDPRLRVLRRMRNHGLGPAVIDGFTAANGDLVACIDADLQHDPSVLPKMVEQLASGAEVAVGSRYAAGGGTGKWNWFRRLGSRIATKMAQIFLGVKLTDPMSGFFMMRRSDFLRVRPQLEGEGFKILLEILVKLRPSDIKEVPYTFRQRVSGESKLSSKVVFEYLQQLWGLSRLKGLISGRFIRFSLVGLTGILANLSVMALLLSTTGVRSWVASALASLIANLNNYSLNNSWTFSDRHHRGFGLLKGYVSYLLMSTVGLGITTASFMGLSRMVAQFPLRTIDPNGSGTLLPC